MVGPTVGPATAPNPNKAIAIPSSSGGHTSISIACAGESKPPPASPCIIRKMISSVRVCACPQKKEAITKRMMENIKYCLRPNFCPIHPDMGRIITLATVYEVTTQPTSSRVAPRLPIIWGIDTLTIVVSINSSNAASITVKVTIHFLAPVSTMG